MNEAMKQATLDALKPIAEKLSETLDRSFGDFDNPDDFEITKVTTSDMDEDTTQIEIYHHKQDYMITIDTDAGIGFTELRTRVSEFVDIPIDCEQIPASKVTRHDGDRYTFNINPAHLEDVIEADD